MLSLSISRRFVLSLLLLAVGACVPLPHTTDSRLPVVFVHGNGDTAAQWITTLWRFESNGYDRRLLHAID
ncbi:MAG: twin-arginine translocation pathway signal, partial [Betaproteobacteria bacterium]